MTTRPKRMLAELESRALPLFTRMFERLDDTLGETNYIAFEGRRSQAVQDAYYAQGRETLAQVNAKRTSAGLYLLRRDEDNYEISWTTKSKHTEGLAMDILPLDNRGNPTWDLAHYRRQFEDIRGAALMAGGIECGADWPADKVDWPHYQVK